MTGKLSPGCKVLLTTGNGSTFKGVFHSFDESLGKVVLKRVTTAGVRLCGLQNFYYSDMTKLQIINEPPGSSAKKTSLPDNAEGNNFTSTVSMMSIQCPAMEEDAINTDEFCMANIDGAGNGGNRCVDKNDGSGLVDENYESGLVDENDENRLLNVNDEYYEKDYYTLIYRLGDKFYEAINYIMKQEAVGVTFEGVSIGRHGTLSVIQISTETDVIAFDIMALGKQAFAEGLQALFESKNIVKVIHDCRWISDMLHEQYKIRVANIFDTQVANACVYRILHNGDWPRYVESLPNCLIKHLKLQPEDVTFPKVRNGVQEKCYPKYLVKTQRHLPSMLSMYLNTPKESGKINGKRRQQEEILDSLSSWPFMTCLKNDNSPWLQRPLSKRLLSLAQKNVSYLTQLHQVLLKKMLYEFRMGVEIYLSHVRNMDGEIESCQNHGYLLPPIFWKIPKLVYLTCDDTKDQNIAKGDIKGNDLPAPERGVFLSHNLVKPKPTERSYATDSDPQDKNVLKYDYEGNAYITLNKKMDSKDWMAEINAACNGYAHSGITENGSSVSQGGTLQEKYLQSPEESVSVNHQDLSLPAFMQRSDVGSEAVSHKECNTQVEKSQESSSVFSVLINKDNGKKSVSGHEQDHLKAFSQKTEVEECQESENNLAFSTITGNGNQKHILVQETDQFKASSQKSLSTHTNVTSGHNQHIVLPIENTSLTSIQLSPDVSYSIRRSKLWQAVNANQVRETTAELSSSTDALVSHSGVQEVLMKTGAEQDMPKEMMPKNGKCAMPKLARTHHDLESASRKSISENSECEATLGKSHLSSSFHSQSPSSDSETSLAHHSFAELDISNGKDYDYSSILPAGYGAVRARKKKVTDQKKSHSSNNKCESNDSFLSGPLDEDLCYIPMQGSLKGRQELSLGVTSFDFGDPLSDSECCSQLPENPQFCMDSHQGSNAETINDDDGVCSFQKSEVFQKVLRMASSLPFENLKSKLLPSKVSLCGK